MSFRDMVARDIRAVFLNTEEFADERIIKYDGEVYRDVPVVISENRQSARVTRREDDHAQGLYRVDTKVNLALSDIGGKQPEKGQRFYLSTDKEGSFFMGYYIGRSKVEMGMVILELEAIDE